MSRRGPDISPFVYATRFSEPKFSLKPYPVVPTPTQHDNIQMPLFKEGLCQEKQRYIQRRANNYAQIKAH